MEPEAVNEAQPFKELVIFVPLIGTAIAISYDVGFFYGIDIKFFTLFSVTEHIVFALEAAPIALAVAISIAAYVGTGLDLAVGIKIYEAGQKIPKQRRRYVDTALLVTVIVGTAALVYFRKFGTLVGGISGLAMSLFRILPFAKRTIYLVAGVLVIITAFAFGHDFARTYIFGGSPRHSIQFENEAVTVKLIRSGDRGVLYYDPKGKQLNFARWETIKKLTSSDLE